MPDPQAEVDDRPAHPQLFISYASGDRARAAALHARLVAEGHTVWFDRARLIGGCDWHKEIEAGCEAARVILPLMTPRWAASEWTRYETYAHGSVIPVLAEGKAQVVMPPPLRRWNAVTLDPLAADEASWQALLAAIRAKLAEPVPERTPRIVDLPYPANPFFTGRDDDLVRIHEELHAAPVAALTQGRVYALAAMGGIGKTTLANEYARRYWRLYPQILWVDARAGLESGFALLFGKLFPGRPDAGMQQADKAKLVLEELAGRAERLLVLDNVEDAESVRPWLVRDPTSGCRTLITSRYADFPAAANIRTIPLDVLKSEPAREFLLKRTKRTAEAAELAACDDLARELGYLPLALEQAGAYIAAPGAGVDFAGYLRLYRAATAELLARGALGSTEYPDSVITTWQTTVAKLSPESRAVLRLCAWYADTPIPRALVMQGADDVLALAASFGPVAPLSGPAAAELRMIDALTGLGRYSMILDATDVTFRTHGLVQAVERVEARASGTTEQAARTALDCLFAAFPGGVFDSPETWPLASRLVPHVVALGTKDGSVVRLTKFADLVEASGRFRHGSGAMTEAQSLLRHALALQEATSGPDSLAAAGCGHNLAHCVGRSKPAEAKQLLQHALHVYERELGEDHRNTLTCMNDIAAIAEFQGDYAEATRQIRIVAERAEKSLGPDHEATLRAVVNLAMGMQALGDAAGALPLHRRALDSRERVLGKEHPDTLTSVNNLASCMRALGDAAGALPLYRRALDSCERVLGKEHPNTLTSVNNLALCMQALGDAAGALPLYRRALDSCERVLGKEHPNTLGSVNNLALCMQALGDAAGVLPLFRRALDSCERVLGKEHPNTLISVNNLAGCLYALGDAAGALPLFRRVLDIRERVLGKEHPNTLISVGNLATCLYALGDAAGALPLFRRALKRSERMLGKEHPNTLTSVQNLASCLDTVGRTVEAEALHRRALESLVGRQGPEHPDVLTTQNNLAVSLRKAGHPDLAEPYARQCADASARVLGAAHPRTLHRRNNMAITLLMMRRTAEARSILAANWAAPCPHSTPVTQSIAFLAAIAALLDVTDATDPLGRLKTLLLGPPLQQTPDVGYPWDIGYLLDYLKTGLPSDSFEFLQAALAAINDPALTPDLDRFTIWRDTSALKLDTPWPDAAD